MTRCRILELCERYKTDIGIYDPKSKRKLPRSVKQKEKCVCIHNNHYCVIWNKNIRDSLLKGLKEIDRIFKYNKNKIHECNIKQRIRYRFPKHETVDQLENVLVIDLETYNDQELAYAAGLFDVSRLRDSWDRDLTVQETEAERENVTDGSNANPVMKMLRYLSENYEGDDKTYIDKDGDEIVSSYSFLFVAHYSSGFDSWVVLNSLVKEITEPKL